MEPSLSSSPSLPRTQFKSSNEVIDIELEWDERQKYNDCLREKRIHIPSRYHYALIQTSLMDQLLELAADVDNEYKNSSMKPLKYKHKILEENEDIENKPNKKQKKSTDE